MNMFVIHCIDLHKSQIHKASFWNIYGKIYLWAAPMLHHLYQNGTVIVNSVVSPITFFCSLASFRHYCSTFSSSSSKFNSSLFTAGELWKHLKILPNQKCSCCLPLKTVSLALRWENWKRTSSSTLRKLYSSKKYMINQIEGQVINFLSNQ